jgi:hypothetical protein
VCILDGTKTDLVIGIKLLIVYLLHKISNSLVGKANSIIEISHPYDSTVIFNRPVPLKAESSIDGLIVIIPFIVICKPGCQMSCHEAYPGV